MNNAEIADRLAARTGLNKAAAKDVVDNVFVTICEALADGDEVRLAGFSTFAARTRTSPHRPQSPNGRGDVDIGVDVSIIQGGEGAQGRGERRPKILTADCDR